MLNFCCFSPDERFDSLLRLDVIGCKTRVKSVNSNWSVSIRLLLVKLSRSVRGLFVGFVYVVN